ncbi:hypothetical protein, partial [Kitasatospora cineracea]|uniref:hypothetical protein n=1 Tax=Kitasatospora cineracea TaxID=88074 RepID=UPI0033F077E7
MTLHLSQPPAGALRAALSALAPEAALSPPSAAVLRRGAGRPRPLLALPVHALRGPAPRLAGADCTGWRFLLGGGGAEDAAPSPCGHDGCTGGSRSADGGPEYGPLAVGEFTEDGLDGVVASAEVVNGPDGPVFSHLSAGPFLDSTVRALRQAWQLTHGTPVRYEPRLLPLPEHYASALWLHGGQPGEDLLIPLAPSPHRHPAVTAAVRAQLDTMP